MHLSMRLKILLALASLGPIIISTAETQPATSLIDQVANPTAIPVTPINDHLELETTQSSTTTAATTNDSSALPVASQEPSNATTTTSAATSSNNLAEPDAELTQLLALTNQSFTQWEQIEALLERLVLVINKNPVKLTEEQQATVRGQLIELRKLVRQIKNGTTLNPTAADLAFGAKVATALLALLKNAIQQDLKTLPALDLAAIQAETKRGSVPNLDAIASELTTNKTQLDTVTENSYNLGTTFTQRLYKNSCAQISNLTNRLDQATDRFKGYRRYAALTALYAAYYFLAPRDNALERNLNIVGLTTAPGYLAGGYLAGEALKFGAKEVMEHSNAYAHPLFSSFITAGLAAGMTRASTNPGTITDHAAVTAANSKPRTLLDLPLFQQEKLVRVGAMGLYWAIGSGIYQALMPKVNHKLYELDRRLKGLAVATNDPNSKLEKPKITFKDVIGNEEIKAKFQVVIDYVTQPDKFDSAGLTPEKGYLLIGGSRAGKSFMAKALAGEINQRRAENQPLNFIALTANDIGYWGWPKLMEFVKYQAPCVVFIDEIDLLNLNRADHGKPNELLANMLTWMAGEIDADPTKQVIVLAATNRPDKLDFALRQHGRFGEIIPFRYPTFAERIEFLQRKLDQNGLTGTLPAELIEQIARETADKPYDDLAAIMNLAQQTAMAQIRPVNAQDFQRALDHYVHRLAAENTGLNLSADEQKLIAAHQAGRVLATLLITPEDRISLVTTAAIDQQIPEQAVANDKCYKPTVQYGSTITYPTRQKTTFNTQQQLEGLVQIDLAGHLAQALLLGSCSYQYQAEEQNRALNLATEIVLAGQPGTALSPTALSAKKDLALKLHELLKTELQTVFVKYQDLLKLIYAELLQHKTLRETELYELVAQYQAQHPTVTTDSDATAATPAAPTA